MFGYVTICEPELKVKDLTEIQGILLRALPRTERGVRFYGADDAHI